MKNAFSLKFTHFRRDPNSDFQSVFDFGETQTEYWSSHKKSNTQHSFMHLKTG